MVTCFILGNICLFAIPVILYICVKRSLRKLHRSTEESDFKKDSGRRKYEKNIIGINLLIFIFYFIYLFWKYEAFAMMIGFLGLWALIICLCFTKLELLAVRLYRIKKGTVVCKSKSVEVIGFCAWIILFLLILSPSAVILK